jgi:hypothetical protein
MMISAKEAQAKRRIEEVLRLRQSALAQQVAGAESVRELPVNIREQIAEELSDELCAKGLEPDSEPNAYGLEMEDLINVCAPWRDAK